MGNQNYIPVGTEFSQSAMAKLTKKFLETREILDPHYAGFEKDFQWQRHVKVSIKDPFLRTRVIGALNQFSDTPEGQHLIRQAGAMEAWRRFHTLTPTAEQKAASILPIIDGDRAHYDLKTQAIWMNRDQIETMEYKVKNGNFYDASVQDILFHELGHAADALITKNNMHQLLQTHAKPYTDNSNAIQSMQKELKTFPAQCPTLKPLPPIEESSKRIYVRIVNFAQSTAAESVSHDTNCPKNTPPGWRKRFGHLVMNEEKLQLNFVSPPTEHAIIENTNKFMHSYYNEPDRILNHGAGRMELDNKYVTQPGLGGDHFYDSIKLPPVPFKPHKPERGSR